jgi:hypothetical protein
MRPDMLLATVRSRCPLLRFQSAGQEAIDTDAREIASDVLVQIAASGDPGRRMDAAKDLMAKTGAGGRSDREQLASHLHAMSALLRDVEVLATRADAGVLANADVRADSIASRRRSAAARHARSGGGQGPDGAGRECQRQDRC